MKSIRVLLADDHTVVREGLRSLLDAEADIEVVGEAETGRQAVQLAGKLSPEVVVMDIAMPLLNGMEATRQILKLAPATKILILSAHGDDAYVEQVMAIGASGYLLKQSSAWILSKAIREVHAGHTFFSPTIARCRQKNSAHHADSGNGGVYKAACLTSREREVLQLVAEGLANKQVAAELDISIKTVEKHRQRLMEKLAIHDTAGLTRYAIAVGIIESSVQVTIV